MHVSLHALGSESAGSRVWDSRSKPSISICINTIPCTCSPDCQRPGLRAACQFPEALQRLVINLERRRRNVFLEVRNTRGTGNG